MKKICVLALVLTLLLCLAACGGNDDAAAVYSETDAGLLGGIPVYAGGGSAGELQDLGVMTMLEITGASQEDFDDYIKLLEKQGFTLFEENELGKAYQKDDKIVSILFYSGKITILGSEVGEIQPPQDDGMADVTPDVTTSPDADDALPDEADDVGDADGDSGDDISGQDDTNSDEVAE